MYARMSAMVGGTSHHYFKVIQLSMTGKCMSLNVDCLTNALIEYAEQHIYRGITVLTI